MYLRYTTYFQYCFSRLYSKEVADFEKLEQQLTSSITPREARLSLSVVHDAPALLGEWFPVQVNLHNNECANISTVIVEVTFPELTPDQSTIDQASKSLPKNFMILTVSSRNIFQIN